MGSWEIRFNFSVGSLQCFSEHSVIYSRRAYVTTKLSCPLFFGHFINLAIHHVCCYFNRDLVIMFLFINQYKDFEFERNA